MLVQNMLSYISRVQCCVLHMCLLLASSCAATLPAPMNFTLTTLSSVCVHLSWVAVSYPGAPSETVKYQVKCNESSWSYVSDANLVCNFQPYTLVLCSLRAKIGERFSEETTASTQTACGIPTKVSFTATFEVKKQNTIHLDIKWQASKSFCESLSHYNLSVSQNGKYFIQMQFDVNAQRELTIKEGIIPYTKYEIAIIAVNTQHNQSETAREDVISPESPPSSGPGLVVKYSAYCATLNFTVPSQPNGNIILYEYDCVETSEFSHSMKLKMSTTAVFGVLSVCNLDSVRKITCAARAYNSAGGSNLTIVEGYTLLPFWNNFHVIYAVYSYGIGRTQITFLNPDYAYSAAKIKSYMIVIKPIEWEPSCLDVTPVSYSQAVNESRWCYITAVIDPAVLETRVELGTGRYYGEYYDAPLQLNRDYRGYVAVDMLQDDVDVQYLHHSFEIHVRDNPCPAAPNFTKYVILNQTGSSIGEVVTYGCEKGFNLKGNDAVVCQLNGTKSEWFGELPKCQPVWKVPLAITLPLIAVIVIFVIVGRNQYQLLNKRSQERAHVEQVYGQPTAIEAQTISQSERSFQNAEQERTPRVEHHNIDNSRTLQDANRDSGVAMRVSIATSDILSTHSLPPSYEQVVGVSKAQPEYERTANSVSDHTATSEWEVTLNF